MRPINVKIERIKNNLFIKIPTIIKKTFHLNDGEDIEISIHKKSDRSQGELWENPIDMIDELEDIYLDISEDLHTLNMYNRIYIPEKYRFYFPPSNTDFYLSTNIGQIKTQITANGYFSKGVRSWIETNGPLEPSDIIHFKLVDLKIRCYEMKIKS